MFGFGKKTSKPARKSATSKAAPKRATAQKATGAKKPARARKAAPARKTRALCVVCKERTQTNLTLRICGRRRCAADLRQRTRSQPAPARAAIPRRAPATRRPATTRQLTTPATAPTTATSDLAALLRDAQRAQIRDWNHHHRQWRNEITRNAAALNRAAALLSAPDRAALADIANAVAAITDDQISRAADADTRARRPSSVAARLLGLSDRLAALTAKYERAGVIRVSRS